MEGGWITGCLSVRIGITWREDFSACGLQIVVGAFRGEVGVEAGHWRSLGEMHGMGRMIKSEGAGRKGVSYRSKPGTWVS